MSIKIGDIDIANQTLDNEFRLGVLERLLESVINNNPNLVRPTQQQVAQIRNEVVEQLRVKYPNSGIELRGN